MMNWLQQLAGGGQQQQPMSMDNPFAAQMAYDNAQQDRQRALQMQQAQYQGGGASGILAGLLTMLGGKQLQKRADETATQALQRQFQYQNEAAAAAAQKEAQKAIDDEKRAIRLLQEKARIEAENRAKTELDYLSPEERVKVARIKGGLQVGAQAPQAPRQPTALEIQLQLAKAQGATPEQLQQLVLGGQGQQQAPANYRWTPDGNLTYIPGGAADPNRPVPVAGEQAARLAMGEVFLSKAPQILKEIKEGALTGPYDANKAALGYGRQGEISRQLASGSDALLRNLTGAGMSNTEAEKYVARYQESRFDTAETLYSKVSQLAEELQAYKNKLAGNAAPQVPGAQGSAGVGGSPDYLSVLAKYSQ